MEKFRTLSGKIEAEMLSFKAQTVAHQIEMKKSVKNQHKEIDDLKNQKHEAGAERHKLENQKGLSEIKSSMSNNINDNSNNNSSTPDPQKPDFQVIGLPEPIPDSQISRN